MIELEDLGDTVGRLATDFDFDPEAIEAVSERMNLWQELRRKYGGSVEAVLLKREELANKLAVQGDKVCSLESALAADALEQALRETASNLLRRAREQTASKLADKAADLFRRWVLKRQA